MPRLIPILTLVLTLAFIVGACDSGPDDAEAHATAVQTAARESGTQSARYQMRLAGIHPVNGEFAGNFAEGEVDFATGSAELRIAGGEAGGEPATMIYHGGKVYQSWQDTPYWLVADSRVAPALGLDPGTMLELLERADDVELIATEDVDGFETTHYRFGFSTEDLDEQDRDSQKGMTGTVDVWISPDRVHRTVSSVEYGPDAQEGLVGMKITTDARLTDWGIDVNVAPPDPSLVKTQEELQALD